MAEPPELFQLKWPIVEVVEGGDITKEAFTLKDDTGIMVNSGFLNGCLLYTSLKWALP